MIHYSYRLNLMSFLFICQLFSVRVAGLLLPTWASKMAINIIPAGHFPQKSLSGNSRIDFPLLLSTKPYLLLPLTHGPPLLYWLGTSGWCLSLMLAPLPCEFRACLSFMRLPSPGGLSGFCYSFYHLFLTSYGVDELLGLRSLYLAFFLSWVLLGHGPFLL